MMKLSTTTAALLLALGLVPLAALAQSAPNTQAGVATAPGKAGAAATTEITAKVQQTLASDKNHWGDPFAASIVRPVKVDGKTVLPRGTEVTGRVYEVTKDELKVVLDSVVVHGVYCDLSTHSRRPSDKDQPKRRGQKKDNSKLSVRTRLTFKLSKPASIPVKA